MWEPGGGSLLLCSSSPLPNPTLRSLECCTAAMATRLAWLPDSSSAQAAPQRSRRKAGSPLERSWARSWLRRAEVH